MSNVLVESCFDTDVLTEAEGKGKQLYIHGKFMVAGKPNGNRRIYTEEVLGPQVEKYINEYVKTGRACGEMNHPQGRIEVDYTNVSHRITEIKEMREGGAVNYIGKALVLEGTPMGALLKGLLEGGCKPGVSSRGTGTTVLGEGGIAMVNPDFRLVTVDVVYQPSAPGAFVDGLMENADFIMAKTESDREFVHALKEKIRATKLKNLQEAKIQAFESFINKCRGL